MLVGETRNYTGSLSLTEELPEYRYDLSETDIGTMVAALTGRVALSLAAQPEATETARYVIHEIAGTDPISNIGRTIECQVFEQAFGNTAEIMADEYGPYEPASTFFIVHDTFDQDVLGVIRIAGEAPIGFKTLVDLSDSSRVKHAGIPLPLPQLDDFFTQHGIEPDKTIDVMTLAVPPKHRGLRSTDIMGTLYHQTIDYSLRHDINHWFMMLDEHAYGIINSIGVPLEPVAGIGPVEYLGSEKTYPLFVNVARLTDSMEARELALKNAIAAGEKKHATLRLNRGMLRGENFRGQLQKIIF